MSARHPKEDPGAAPGLDDRMVDEAANEAARQELLMLAREVENHRMARKHSISRLLRDWPTLGSDKTFNKLVKGDVSELNVENQLRNYRKVSRSLTAVRNRQGAEPRLPDMRNAEDVRQAVAELHLVTGHERLVIIQGATATGKTTALQIVAADYAGSVLVEANESWRSLSAMLADLCIATGARGRRDEVPNSNAEKIDLVCAALGQRAVLVLIDEGHHLSAQCLNVIKTFLNRTKALFVISAIDTLWGKLQAASWQEAKQLVLNRMHCRVVLGPPDVDDVKLYVKERIGLVLDDKTASELTQAAGEFGNHAFVRRVCTVVMNADPKPEVSAIRPAIAQAVQDIKGRK